MKNLYIKKLVYPIFLSLLLFTTSLQAKNYYISATGSDINDGLTPATAWKTITKVNTMFNTFVAGDNILFQSGDTFYGSIIVNKSGTSTSPIVIGAYGTGAKPVITGFTTATGFTSIGTNLWQSSAVPGTNREVSMVTINGMVTGMGRYPNTGYRTFTSCTPTTSITDPTLSGTPNWKGATVCVRKLADIISRDSITDHVGTTITYSGNLSGYNSINGYGYFVQNSLLALDIQNEWYFNTNGRKLTVYSTGNPANVKIATKDTLVYFGGFDYITVDGLAFEGADKAAICLGGPMTGQVINPVIKNCDINYSGRDAIYGSNNSGLLVNNCKISNSLNNGILLESEGGRSLNATITNNIIKNTGTIAGMGYLNTSAGYVISYNAITNVSSPLPVVAQTYTVQYNQIDTTGHVGILFYCNDAKIKNNFVNYHNYVTDDAGGINTFDVTFGGIVETGREITNNIILNGIGAGAGTVSGENVALGIYIDDKADGLLVQGNSVANHARAAFYIHNATNIIVRDNTFYNSGEMQSLLTHDSHATGMPIRNIAFKKNILFAKQSTQLVSVVRTRRNDADSIFNTIDSNIYARPILPTGDIIQVRKYYQIAGDATTKHTLPSWKTAYNKGLNGASDPHTTFVNPTITSTNDIRFEYNAANTAKTITLDAKYIDVYGTVYNGSITLQPFSSAVLTKSGELATNKTPVANSGTDQAITLPANSIALTGSGTDADGTISSYAWIKISGPSAGTIATPGAASTAVNSLVQGVYTFEMTVTDNNGATGKDTVQVSVNPAANKNPVADAGTNKTITLPTNTITLTGSGTDIEGTINSYAWLKISGPSAGTIASYNTASTTVNNLVEGNYEFELTVTDNNGAIGKDTVQVTVIAAANKNPVGDAGANKTITLPTNTTTLTGSATDIDGTVKSYTWLKISGPSAGTIASYNTASTTVNNLVEGNYEFELTVTDNSGAIGKDTVQVTVNAAPNQEPIANAGADIIIRTPANSTTLSGSGTSAGSTIRSYKWVKVSGPASCKIALSYSAKTLVKKLVEGSYQFELTVTNNNGATGKDTVQVTVSKPAKHPPVAKAGSNSTITLPVNTAILAGNSMVSDGTISNIAWVKIAGPSSGTITSASNSATLANNLVQGVYQYELTVTDNSGSIGKDTVQVTVNAPVIINQVPAMNAGTQTNNGFKVYPNPVRDIANLSFTGGENAKLSISVTDMGGRLVKYNELVNLNKSKTFKLDMSGLSNGYYVITVRFDDGQRINTKVMKYGGR